MTNREQSFVSTLNAVEKNVIRRAADPVRLPAQKAENPNRNEVDGNDEI